MGHFKYISTKTYHNLGSVAYRQWKADSHCHLVHGYSMSFHFEFGCNDLDARNWCVDFGGLKPLKDLLEDWFDHTLLVAENDPHKAELVALGKLGLAKIVEVEATGCEALSNFLFEYINSDFIKSLGYSGRVMCTKVEVRETQTNMAMRVATDEEQAAHVALYNAQRFL
jgi:6-pyruvoyltetrahydropterin/6-carboxytetrahydropterin synthase